MILSVADRNRIPHFGEGVSTAENGQRFATLARAARCTDFRMETLLDFKASVRSDGMPSPRDEHWFDVGFSPRTYLRKPTIRSSEFMGYVRGQEGGLVVPRGGL